jgi:hypothetical protein
MLANAKWRTISWRNGTKGKLKARFAAVRVRVADGPPQRIRDKGQQHLPGDEAWLIGEHRMSGEKKYYLANLPVKTDLRTLAATIKARWICEQAHQQMKEELGLDHFEGRSWQGPSPSCAHDDDRLRLPPASPAGNSKAGKKESTGRRLSQLCPPYATPSSNSSLDYRRSGARIVLFVRDSLTPVNPAPSAIFWTATPPNTDEALVQMTALPNGESMTGGPPESGRVDKRKAGYA